MKKCLFPLIAAVLCALAASSHAAPRLKYPFIPEKLEIAPEERLLIVAPHPDDEALGAGGLLALYGEQCDVLVLTDGAKGHKGVPEDIEKDVRARQFLAEMELVKPRRHIMLGLPDAALWDHKTCLNDFDMSGYTKVFAAECDAHPDHAAACAFVVERLWGMARRGEKVPELYLYEVHKPLGNVSHALDITDVMERKRAFIRCHEDQLPQYCYEQIAADLNSLRASQQNKPGRFFEAYCLVEPDFGTFARALFPDGLPQDVCLNVNFPFVEQLQGVSVCRMARGNWLQEWRETEVPGEYCLTGYFTNLEPEAEDTDYWALQHGIAAVTPIQLDMTHYPLLGHFEV